METMDNFTVFVPPICLTMENCLPNLATILEMIRVMMTSWLKPQCEPPYTSMISSNMICIYNFIVLISYSIILVLILTLRKLNFNFKVCIALLYVSDSITLIMSARESVITGCALNFRVDLNLVWQGIGGALQDLLIYTNLLMAFLRYYEISHMGVKPSRTVPLLGALLAILLSLATFLLHITGNVTSIWFTAGYYQELYLWPFQPLRIVLLILSIFLAAVFYISCAFRIVTMSVLYLRREKFVLFTSLCVFVSQIIFTYASFWMGAKLGIGDISMNANLSYFARPICCSVAPALQMLYLCSSNMRFELRNQLGTIRGGIRHVTRQINTKRSQRRVSIEPISASTIRTNIPRASF